MKTISATLGVARSNVIERRDGLRARRGPQERPGDVELAGAIRRFVDKRPTYGYRRIAALLKRERRSDGLASVNAKRVYRLMKKHGLLLERHTGRRRAREHDGQVVTIRSNCRWCSDALEFTCWNGEVVRVAFALDCHDREAISWVATTAGISGEMIRDMMVQCVEKRFGTIRAPHPVQWLSDNGSIFAAHKTIDIALALNSPRVSPRSKARKAMAWPRLLSKPSSATMSGSVQYPMPLAPWLPLIIGWRITIPSTPIPGWATAHPGNTSFLNSPRVRFDGVNSRSRLSERLVLIEFIPIGRLGFDDQAPLHSWRIVKLDVPLQYPLGDQDAGVFTPLFRRLALGCNDLVEVRACWDPKPEAVVHFGVLRHVMMKDGHDWPPP